MPDVNLRVRPHMPACRRNMYPQKRSRDHLGSVMKAGPLIHSQHNTPRNYSAEQKKPDPNRVHTCVMPSAYKCTQITNPKVREMAVYLCACACVCEHTHTCVTENRTHILRQELCCRAIPQSSFHPFLCDRLLLSFPGPFDASVFLPQPPE